MPDLFRERFGSPAVGLVALAFILFFMSFMMVAQFKAGALIMKISWPGSGALALVTTPTPIESRPTLASLAEAGLPRRAGQAGTAEGRAAPIGQALKESWTALTSEERQITKPGRCGGNPFDWLFLLGLVVFALTVVFYTLIGGFLAACGPTCFRA